VTVFYPQALPEVKEKEDLLPSLEALKDWRLSVTEMFAWLSL
jgi:Uma2 family endonuclease